MSEKGDELIGGFRVIESLHGGSGAQGVVSKAICEDPKLPGMSAGEIVALKVMSVADEDGAAFSCLQQRTEVLRTLDHPNVVRYRGCFQVVESFKSQHVVVMELLEGETLKERLADARHGMDADKVLSIITKAIVGLQRAAEAGIVHRDVKPANIFLCRDGSVKVIDFEYAHSDTGSVSTTGGRFLGTFDYMAPEFTDVNFRGDERSDVFSMGVVLHEALCGQTPYAVNRKDAGQADFEFLARWSDADKRQSSLKIRSRAYRALSGMDDVLQRALSPDCKKRFSSFAEFKNALDGVKYREFSNGGRCYRLLRQVGKGGFGEVFKARMMPENRFVAVKNLLKAAYGDRFRREARLMERFHDPSLTRFIDYFEVERNGAKEAYLVMDFLPDMPGSSLRDAINASAPARLDPQAVLTAFAHYAHGLSILHGGKVYHRDIKPSNLYFPRENPDGAVIMDMGIARDAGGSVTVGDVPGTLDYMPPEIVTIGGRGDARMDIYALGLCFYEALTGRQGFSRLPQGTDGLRAFYERSRSLTKPLFDDGEIVRRPPFLDLLRWMTNPDCSKRLDDARELERRLRALNWSVVQEPSRLKHSFVSRKVPAVQGGRQAMMEAATRETSAQRQEIVRAVCSPQTLRWMKRFALGLTAAVVLAIGGLLMRIPLSRGVDHIRSWQVEQQLAAEREANENREKKAAEKADHDLREANAKTCRSEEALVISAYASALSLDEPDRKFDQWKTEWSNRPLPSGVLDSCLSEIATARENCFGRQSDRLKTAENAADAVQSEYMNTRSIETADVLAENWKKTWSERGVPKEGFERLLNNIETAHADCLARLRRQEQIESDAARRQANLAKQLNEARTESESIRAAYIDSTVRLSTVDAQYADWQKRWNALADSNGFKTLDGEMRKAQSERMREERERGVMDECRALIGNIWSMTSFNVRNWRVSLDRAENEVKRAWHDKRLSMRGREALVREIASARKWQVGVIENKTYETISFMGRKVQPVSEALFVLTHGLPSHAAVTSEGYEPIRVTAEQFDGRTLVVMKSDLVQTTGRASLEIPALEEGVVCLVDGIMRECGVIKLPVGQHECLYRNLRETCPGVRDFVEQRQVVAIAEGETLRLKSPEVWVESTEFKSAQTAEKVAAKGADIVLAVEKGLEIEPIETRRERLEKVFSILNNWQTPALLGNRRLAELNAKYEIEHKRVIGRIVNDLSITLRVKVRENWVTVKPCANELITYDNGMPADARIAVEGYEYLPLPDSEDFDGKTFVVTEAKLDPTPVMVSVPSLEDGVTCRIAGKLTRDTVELKPGRYMCSYSRTGYVDQRFSVEVAVNRDLTLPSPKPWKRANVFERLADTIQDVNESAERGIQSAKEALEYR